MVAITISKTKIQKEGGVIILSLKEYQKLREQAASTYYLKGRRAKALDRLIDKGLKDYRAGKCINAGSLKEALRIYGKKNKEN